jgi:hypothetical protein
LQFPTFAAKPGVYRQAIARLGGIAMTWTMIVRPRLKTSASRIIGRRRTKGDVASAMIAPLEFR